MNVPETIPQHIGFIVDGNRRWAKQKGKKPQYGHRKGADNLKDIANYCLEAGIKYMSAYIWSRENWKRPQVEIDFIMDLTTNFVDKELDELYQKGVRIRHIGSRSGLSEKVLAAIDRVEEKTKDNTAMTIGLCFNYGGQHEIVEAAQQLMRNEIKADAVTFDEFKKHLYAPDLPAIDFIVRTSGEQRLSNFMLWRAAYAEFYFPKTLWPDFKQKQLEEALEEFAGRQRRFGGS